MVHITDEAMQPFEKEHIDMVRKLASECAVLLKTNGDFPLETAGKIAVFGSGARRTIKGGTGSGDVNVRTYTTIEQGLKNAGFTVVSEKWLDSYETLLQKTRKNWIAEMKKKAVEAGADVGMYCMGKVMPEPSYKFSLQSSADIALYVLARNSGEGADRMNVEGDIKLTETEIRDILTLQETYKKFMLVLNVGGMLDLTPVNAAKNILILSQLGTPTGDVLADIILGKANPSGKLTMTWAPLEKYPSTEGFGNKDDTYYREGIFVGYRYFDSVGEEVTYPFGFGKSYTTFKIIPSDIDVDGNQVYITAFVKNTGNFKGKEVVQAYVSAPAGILEQPFQKLVGYSKTDELMPGETVKIEVSFKLTDLSSFCEQDCAYVMEPGEYIVRVGNQSRDTQVVGIIDLKNKIITEKVKHICYGTKMGDKYLLSNRYKGKEKNQYPTVKRIMLQIPHFKPVEYSYSQEAQEMPARTGISLEDVKMGKSTLQEFVACLTDAQLACLAVGNYKDSSEGAEATLAISMDSRVAGAAGETTGFLNDLGVTELCMADGPAGLRLSNSYKIVNGKIKECANAFSNFKEFFDEEELQKFAEMLPKPSEEEKKAPLNYQYCTAIPIGTAIAQSWNDDIAEKFGDIVGEEMELFGVHLWLAPAQNIQRSPLCGRNFEYYSEDPYVSGRTAAAVTRGVQRHKGCGVTIKHFVCNNQETNRFSSNSIVSERALREIYLKSFEICIKSANPEAIMSSYNLVNGEHTCNSKDLLTYVLRDEWGYKGIVMTDWYVTGGMEMLIEQRDNKYTWASAAGCVKAGNNLTMPGSRADYDDILDALTNPEHPYTLTKAQLQKNAIAVVEKILKLQ